MTVVCSRRHWRHDTPQCSVIHSQTRVLRELRVRGQWAPASGPISPVPRRPDSCHQSSDLDVIISGVRHNHRASEAHLETTDGNLVSILNEGCDIIATQTVSSRSKLRDSDLHPAQSYPHDNSACELNKLLTLPLYT